MARRPRSSVLENRSNRLKLPVRRKAHAFTTIAAGIAVGYRRNQHGGMWVLRAADGRGGRWIKNVGLADDHELADGEHVLSFWQACDRARALARGKDNAGRPVTVDEALSNYEIALRVKGGSTYNARWPRRHLPASLLAKPVALLAGHELERWRNGLIADGMTAQTAHRMCKGLAAALTAAARNNRSITNQSAWRNGLSGLHDVYRVRDAGLGDDEVLALVRHAYAHSVELGRCVEVHAVTGSRTSQIVRLTVGDLLPDPVAPRLQMPTSHKGRNRHRKVGARPVPITRELADQLAMAAAGRASDEPLLLRPDGRRWQPKASDFARAFAQVAAAAGVKCTPIALRHSAIIRSLIAGVPPRVIAANADTSLLVLERTYSKYISDHADEVARRGLLSAPSGDAKVVALPGRRP